MLSPSPLSHIDSVNDGPWILAIDLGGTSIKLGLFSGLQLVAHHAIDTSTFATPADAFEGASEFVRKQSSQIGRTDFELDAIGLAMAGVIDSATGILEESANLQRWLHCDFLKPLEKIFRRNAFIINDATAAALGEFSQIESQSDSLALVTLGTGVGSGIVLNGNPLTGSHQCGGEIGHASIEYGLESRMCGCGKRGHVEAYCGAAGIVQTAHNFLARYPEKTSKLRGSINLSPLDIFHASESGDWVALQTVDWTGFYVGRAISLLAHTIDPAVVLVGGAINFGGSGTQSGRRFLENVRTEFARVSLKQLESQTLIDFAGLGGRAGLYGAAHFALINLKPITLNSAR